MNGNSLTGLFPEEISSLLNLKEKYRGEQIFREICKGSHIDDGFSSLPVEIRGQISRHGPYSTVIERNAHADDGTDKFLIRLDDGTYIESVVLADRKDRLTLCVSSQAGCSQGCRFCRTASMGFIRNCSAAEIMEQLIHAVSLHGRIDNIVFMGMGEPLLNLGNVLKAIELIRHPAGFGISPRRITISTCGIIRGIRELISGNAKERLAVSLNSADQKIRESLMPVTKTNPLSDLRKVLMMYREKIGKRITLEYVLMDGVNNRREDIGMLIRFMQPLDAVLNIIPWNSVEGMDFKPPDDKSIMHFCENLRSAGISCTRRYSRGRGINGACGQLAVTSSLRNREPP